MAHGINHSLLAQSMPLDGTTVQLLEILPEIPQEITVKGIAISNNTDQDQEFSIFCNVAPIASVNDFGPVNAIAYKLPIRARSMVCFTEFWPISGTGQSFGVQSSAGSALTFTFFGARIPLTA